MSTAEIVFLGLGLFLVGYLIGRIQQWFRDLRKRDNWIRRGRY